MAQIWFIKSTYNGNSFKVSEFFNADGTYKKNVGSNLEVDMPFNDGISLIDAIHHKTTNGTHIRDYTHFIVPDKNKVYRINKIDELNHDTLRMEVEDEPWIGEYWNYKDKNLRLTSTNSGNLATYYQGINNVSDLSTDWTASAISIPNATISGSKIWALVFIPKFEYMGSKFATGSTPGKMTFFKININQGNNILPLNVDTYSSLANLRLDYPEFIWTSSIPQSQVNDYIRDTWYYGKWARVGNNIYEYTYKDYSLKWVQINNIYTASEIPWWEAPSEGDGSEFHNQSQYSLYTKESNNRTSNTSSSDNKTITNYFRSLYPESPGVVLALPVSTYLSSLDGMNNSETYRGPLLTANSFGGISSSIMDYVDNVKYTSFAEVNVATVRLVPEEVLFGNGSKVRNKLVPVSANDKHIYSSVEGEWLDSVPLYFNPPNMNSNMFEQDFSGVRLGVLKSTNQRMEIGLTASAGHIFDKPPFKKYRLFIYGQEYEVPANYINNLTMVQSITTTGVNYSIYRDKELTKLYISGTASFEAMWNVTAFEKWAAQNPTYKDEHVLRKQQKWAETLVSSSSGIVSSAAGGAMIGGLPGAVGGAISGVIGAGASAIGTHIQNKHQDQLLELQEKAQRLKSPHLNGDPSNSSLLFKVRTGIFWIVDTPNNLDNMKYEYYTKGYPTSKYTSIDTLDWQIANPIYSRNKVLSGYLINTVRNNYTTDMINLKLSDGVVIIE